MILWLADELRAAGLTVHEVAGWKSRTASGSFSPVAAMHHHTASNRNGGPAPALNTVTFGRPDLSGPLCNCLVARNGDIYVVAAGRANHAGTGGPWRIIPQDSGNMYMVGFEWENDGIGEPWPQVQLDAGRLAEATILKHLLRDSSWVYGHKEWAPTRKIDPFPLSMDNERKQVGLVLTGGGTEEGFMGLSFKDEDEFGSAMRRQLVGKWTNADAAKAAGAKVGDPLMSTSEIRHAMLMSVGMYDVVKGQAGTDDPEECGKYLAKVILGLPTA